MNKRIQKESQALLQVWKWKEEVYQETKTLTHQEYLERIEKVAAKIHSKYHFTLPKVDLQSTQQS